MRRTVFLLLGSLEIICAAFLFCVVWLLPGPAAVYDRVGRIERVGRQTSAQVRNLRNQVHLLGQSQPGARRLADEMQVQLQRLGDNLKDEHINQAMQGAVEAADRLEKSIASLRRDAEQLNEYVQASPKDLTKVRALHGALVRLGDTLDRLSTTVEPQNVEAMTKGLVGIENALTAGADRLTIFAGMAYPVVGLEGIWPTVSYRKLWPEGEIVAAALRQASQSAGVTRKELDAAVVELPRLRETLGDSRQATARARELLAAAAKNQDRIEELLKDLPDQTTALANDLPKVGAGLTRLLPSYESSLENSRRLVEGLSAAVPIYTQQLGEDLEEQERHLVTLGQSIDDATAGLPEVGVMGAHLLIMTRLFLSFLGAIFLLHGGCLALSPAAHSAHHREPAPLPTEAG